MMSLEFGINKSSLPNKEQNFCGLKPKATVVVLVAEQNQVSKYERSGGRIMYLYFFVIGHSSNLDS